MRNYEDMIEQIVEMKNKKIKGDCFQILFEMMLKDQQLSQKVKRKLYNFLILK